MNRLALVSLAAITLGCVPAYQGESGGGPGSGVQEASEREQTLPGTYTCTLERGEDGSPPESCSIASRDGVLTLETSSVTPLRGTLTPIDGGFRFRGELQCPEPGCPLPIETDFFADEGSSDSYSGIAVLDSGGILRMQIRKQ